MPVCGVGNQYDYVHITSTSQRGNVDERWCGDAQYALATDESEVRVRLVLGEDRQHHKKGFALRYTGRGICFVVVLLLL